MVKKRAVCTHCGETALEVYISVPVETEGTGFPFIRSILCPNGFGEITEDGLLINTEDTPKKYSYALDEPEEGSSYTLCKAPGLRKSDQGNGILLAEFDGEVRRISRNTVDITSARKMPWNSKAAQRRFRQLLSESNNKTTVGRRPHRPTTLSASSLSLVPRKD